MRDGGPDDAEDGIGGADGRSRVLKQLHGVLEERAFFREACVAAATALGAPAVLVVPMLLGAQYYARYPPPRAARMEAAGALGAGPGLLRAEADPAQVNLLSACCLPWMMAWIAIIVQLAPLPWVALRELRAVPRTVLVRKPQLPGAHQLGAVWLCGGLALLLSVALMDALTRQRLNICRGNCGALWPWALHIFAGFGNFLIALVVQKATQRFFRKQYPLAVLAIQWPPQFLLPLLNSLAAILLSAVTPEQVRP